MTTTETTTELDESTFTDEGNILWNEADDYRVTHLLKLQREMLEDNGYSLEMTNRYKKTKASIIFNKDYVIERFAIMLEDLFLAEDEKQAIALIKEAVKYSSEKVQRERSKELKALIDKYGKDAITALL